MGLPHVPLVTLPLTGRAAPGSQPSSPKGKPNSSLMLSHHSQVLQPRCMGGKLISLMKKVKQTWHKLLEINTTFQAYSNVFASIELQWQRQPSIYRSNTIFKKNNKCTLLPDSNKEKSSIFLILSTFNFKPTPVIAHLQNVF